MCKGLMRYLLVDVDNTLYPQSTGVLERVDARIEEFLMWHFSLPKADLQPIRLSYWQRYGTTLGGLMAERHVNPEEYLAFIHDVAVESLLAPDRELNRLLGSIRAAKMIFTNACRDHAWRVTEVLGIAHHFDLVFDIRDMDFIGKPDPRVYRRLLECLGAEAGECVLLDDSPRNLRTGKELGMCTVQVGKAANIGNPSRVGDGIVGDYHIAEIGLLGEIAAEIGLL